ncbi:hypothetical protein FDECE_15253 [Fusarium decemcellulare]|nr:hypothetical protein FDECE_15253 [Fusarium decemcellulare]
MRAAGQFKSVRLGVPACTSQVDAAFAASRIHQAFDYRRRYHLNSIRCVEPTFGSIASLRTRSRRFLSLSAAQAVEETPAVTSQTSRRRLWAPNRQA